MAWENTLAVSRQQVVYIAGPVTGIAELNYPAFAEATATLRAEDYHVLSPAEINGDPRAPWSWWMRQCIPMVAQADLLMMLPGWEKSRGAKFELYVATRLDIPIYSYVGRHNLSP